MPARRGVALTELRWGSDFGTGGEDRLQGFRGRDQEEARKRPGRAFIFMKRTENGERNGAECYRTWMGRTMLIGSLREQRQGLWGHGKAALVTVRIVSVS